MKVRKRVTEDRHGFPGAVRALGGVGGHVGAPHTNRKMRKRVTEDRHGFPGAVRALGGVGGHVGAPHTNR